MSMFDDRTKRRTPVWGDVSPDYVTGERRPGTPPRLDRSCKGIMLRFGWAIIRPAAAMVVLSVVFGGLASG